MDKAKIFRILNQDGSYKDVQIKTNASNVDTEDGSNVQIILDDLNNKIENDINNRFLKNEESIQELGKDKTAILNSIDNLQVEIANIDKTKPTEAMIAEIEEVGLAQIQIIAAARNSSLSDLNTSTDGQIDRIKNVASDYTEQQINRIQTASDNVVQNQITSINNAGATKIADIQSAGTAKIADIQSAGATQVAAVQTKGDQVLDSIPADYTELSGDVTQLKADLNESVSDLKSAIGYLEDDAYTNIVNKTSVLSSNPFIALDATLRSGKRYQINLQFKDITNNNLSKITAIRLYTTGTSSSAYENITFSVAYNQMQANIVYTAFVDLSIDATYMLIAFNSAASFSTDSVVIGVNDMSVKFASYATGEKAVQAVDSLTKQNGISDVDFTVGYYMQHPDGTIMTNNNFMLSDYIRILPQTQITYMIHGYNRVCVLAIYDENKSLLQVVASGIEKDLSGTITFASDAYYIRVCRWATSKNANDTLSFPTIINAVAEIEELQNNAGTGKQWDGKIWHCFGTSISNANNEGKYPPYLVSLSGLQYVNFGYSGGKIMQQILNQIRSDSSIANADLITVEGFVNDWSQQSPLGTITDTTEDTFYGALYVAITYILSNSNATLVFITDTTGQNYDGIDLRRQSVRGGHTQNDFIKATIEMCEYMGVPVIDAGRKSCISQDTASLYLVDQIHHTEKGGEQYANTIWSELKNIQPRVI